MERTYQWIHDDIVANRTGAAILVFNRGSGLFRVLHGIAASLRCFFVSHRSRIVKLLVFAHTPPPHHGQSYMVELMLRRFGGDVRRRSAEDVRGTSTTTENAPLEPTPTTEGIECFHVNARFSDDVADMGQMRFAKFLLVFRYCAEAIWLRFRYGVRHFYFVPAPPKRPALYRDWIVMLLCRPFFTSLIQQWHAAGLGDWLNTDATWFERWLSTKLLGGASLGIALAVANLRDPLWLKTRDVAVVAYGIPDPFPHFDHELLPRRRARLEARRSLMERGPLSDETARCAGAEPDVFRLLNLAHCFRGKGIFETLEGVARAQRTIEALRYPVRLHLTVAGDFSSTSDKREFFQRIAQPDLQQLVEYVGFVSGEEKLRLLQESDCLCFPTYYHLESFGLVVIEAMAAALNIVTTRWRALPEILPADYPGFVPIKNADAIATVIPGLFTYDATPLRARFLERFAEDDYVYRLREALLRVEPDGTAPAENAKAVKA